jgi:outer membrane protein OmpA-like peptidoglycan-associated protein
MNMRSITLPLLALVLSLASHLALAADEPAPVTEAPASANQEAPQAVTTQGSATFATREAKSGKAWSAKKVSYRFELAGGGSVDGTMPGAGPTSPTTIPSGIHKLHVQVGDRVVPPVRVLISPHGVTKFEFLVATGRVDIRQTFEFGQIAFESSKALLLEESRARLESVAKLMKEHPAIKRLSIEGFTDSSGNAKKNTDLSAERAKTVQAFLVEQGVDSDRLEHHGFGSERPLVDNGTPAGRAVNRRVEFVVKDLDEKDEKPAPAPMAPIVDIIKDSAEAVVEAIVYPWAFVGIDFGKATVKTDEPLELNKDGNYLSAKVLMDFYFPSFTLEGGGGIFNATFPEKSQGNIVGESASIQTLFIQGAIRYPMPYGLEAGLVSHIMFGAANDFGPVSRGKHENYFMGLEALYQPHQFKNLRVALDFLQDYTINSRNVSLFTIGVQMGLEVNERPKLFSEKPSEPVAVAPAIPEAPVIAEVTPPPPPPPAPPAQGALILVSREATSGKKWSGKAISYSIAQGDKDPVVGEFADGGPTAPLDLAPGRYTLSALAGDKKTNLVFFVQPASTVKIEVLAAKGRIELRQLLDIGEIKFESGNDVILAESEPKLVGLATLLKENPSLVKMSIEGFTDSSGNAAKNLDLSRRRAESVRRFLMAQGIAEDRMESHGYGDQRPIADNATPQGRAVNRRVEFVVKQVSENMDPAP